MSERSILQIVPRRTSAPDGIGDYAVHLADGLKEHHNIQSVFICGTPSGIYPSAKDEWPTASVKERTARALVEAIAIAENQRTFSAVILHVGGYGYAKRGAPLWLLAGMRQWRRQTAHANLVNVFHELFATGKVWNSSFWLSPLQKHVARQLWHLADRGLTTNSRYLAELTAWRPDAADRLLLMPVVSNVGEPEVVPASANRAPRAVVFGSAGLEKILYEEQFDVVGASVRALGIREIVDIGSRHRPPPSSIGGATVTCLGRQPAKRISRELLDCRYGLMTYDIARLGKSTVFAAYAAHGVIPVCFGSSAQPADGLATGTHLLQPPVADIDIGALAAMQRDLISWYAGHTAQRLIEAIAQMCSPMGKLKSEGAEHGATCVSTRSYVGPPP